MNTQTTRTNSTMSSSPDSASLLEKQLAYRVRAYLHAGRSQDSEFGLTSLRVWMLCQSWPFPAPSAWLECLAVLSWSAMCAIDTEPEREIVIRGELGRQMDYLDGANVRRPVSLDAFRSEQARMDLYTNLRMAALPESSQRQTLGVPRFNPADTRR